MDTISQPDSLIQDDTLKPLPAKQPDSTWAEPDTIVEQAAIQDSSKPDTGIAVEATPSTPSPPANTEEATTPPTKDTAAQWRPSPHRNLLKTESDHIDEPLALQVKKEKLFALERQRGFEGEPLATGFSYWPIWPLLAVLIILARVKLFSNKKIKEYFGASFSNRFIDQLMRDEETSFDPLNIVLSIVYVICAGLVFMKAFELFFENTLLQVNWKTYTFFCCGLLIYFLLKLLFINLSKIIFGAVHVIEQYAFHLLLFTKILGILLVLPAVFSWFGMIELKPFAVYTGLGIHALLIFLRIGKSFLTGMATSGISVYYIILYICTLEILPLAVLIKATVL